MKKKFLYCFLGKDKIKLSLGLMITKTIKVSYIITLYSVLQLVPAQSGFI